MKSTKFPTWGYFAVFLILCFVIIVSTIPYFILIDHLTGIGKPLGERGTFGDMFGAFAAVFSGLAFVGVIITIIMQMNELRSTVEAQESQSEKQRLRSTIEAMNSIKEIIKSRQIAGPKEDDYIASQIIEYEVQNIFKDNRYINTLRPEIIPGRSQYEIKDPTLKSKQTHVKLELENRGVSAKNVRIENESYVLNSDLTEVNHQKRFFATVDLENSDYKDDAIFISKCKLTGLSWKQIVSITHFVENKRKYIELKISEPERA